MNWRAVPAIALAALSACAHPAPATKAPAGPTPVERLAAADALLAEGCLDCLFDAYREYVSLQSIPAAADLAARGVVRASALIAVRERELGMVDEGYLRRAREAAAATPAGEGEFAQSLEALDAVPPRAGPRDPAVAQKSLAMSQNRADWSARLRAHADDDALSGVAWLWFTCAYAPTRGDRDFASMLAPITKLHDSRLMLYEAATCAVGGDARQKQLADADPRFHELDFWFGSQQISQQKLDDAEQTLTRAYEWHPEWPAVINSLANLSLTAEDFQGALDLYEKSIALVPGMSDSLLGRVRALSYLGRYQEGIARATELLPIGPPGDAYYWRAWNRNQSDAIEDAWTDIQAAERVWHNNEVLKLAGMIAYRRRELDIAATKFEGALQIEGNDCEARFALSGVRIELNAWAEAASQYDRTSTCLENARAQLAVEISQLQKSDGNPQRIARQIAHREQQRAAALRMQTQAWFNSAVANLQLGQKDKARDLADKVKDDEQFGARAREILARVR